MARGGDHAGEASLAPGHCGLQGGDTAVLSLTTLTNAIYDQKCAMFALISLHTLILLCAMFVAT